MHLAFPPCLLLQHLCRTVGGGRCALSTALLMAELKPGQAAGFAVFARGGTQAASARKVLPVTLQLRPAVEAEMRRGQGKPESG